MKQYLKKTGLFFITVIIAYIFFFDYSEAIKRRIPFLQKAALQENITFTLDDLELTSPTHLDITGLDASMLYDGSNLEFFIDQGGIGTRLAPLFFFDTTLDANLEAYDGSIVLNWVNNLLSREATLNINASKISLLKHPAIFEAGLSGKLLADATFHLTGSQFSGFDISEGDIHIEILNGHYNGGHSIFRSIESPEIKDISVSLYAKMFQKRMGINALDIFSSLGRASGSGFVHLNSRNQVERGRVELDARLTPDGAQIVGGYFALGAGESVENPGRNWKILATKSKNKAWDFQVRPQS